MLGGALGGRGGLDQYNQRAQQAAMQQMQSNPYLQQLYGNTGSLLQVDPEPDKRLLLLEEGL